MLTTAYALDKKTEIFPSKGIHGYCLDCGKEVISKCGTLIAHHFAHSVESNCGSQFHDHKSEWHQLWQHTISPAIPGVNVEVTISIDKTVKRADLISHAGIVIEFQHSSLSIVERMDREMHYKNLIWVVHINKENSKTWTNYNSRVPIFYNGDTNVVSWKNRYHIDREHFIRTVINNRFFTFENINTLEARCLKKTDRSNQALYLTIAFYNFNTFESDLQKWFLSEKNYKDSRIKNEMLLAKQRLSEQRFFSSKANFDFARMQYLNDITIEEISEKTKWVQLSIKVIEHYASIRNSRKREKLEVARNKNFNIFISWLFHTAKIFPSIKKDWVTSLEFVDKTPLPKEPVLSRKSKRAHQKEIRRGMK